MVCLDMKCFDAGFQRESVRLVRDDTGNKYFCQGGQDPVLSKDRQK